MLRSVGERTSLTGNLNLGCAGTAALLFLIFAGLGTLTEKDEDASPIDKLNPADCEAAIQSGIRIGLIRQRAATRMDVDEIAWATLPAKDKEALTWSLLCSARQSARSISAAAVYGYHSGKELAFATPYAPSLED